MNWKIEFNKRYENTSWWSEFFDDRKIVFEFIDNLLKNRQANVLQDCIEQILGCGVSCEECDQDYIENECPFKHRVKYLKQKYIKE
jgi:hypothetical protein